MNCVVEKRFLFWTWNVFRHDYKVDFIYQNPVSTEVSYYVAGTCKKCGRAEVLRTRCSYDTMLLNGFSPESLNHGKFMHVYFDENLNIKSK